MDSLNDYDKITMEDLKEIYELIKEPKNILYIIFGVTTFISINYLIYTAFPINK